MSNYDTSYFVFAVHRALLSPSSSVVDRDGRGDVSSAVKGLSPRMLASTRAISYPLCSPSELSINSSFSASLSTTRILSSPEDAAAASRLRCWASPTSTTTSTTILRIWSHSKYNERVFSQHVDRAQAHACQMLLLPVVVVLAQFPRFHVVISDCETGFVCIFVDISTECSRSVYQVFLLVTILRYWSACVLCCSTALLPISSKEVHPRSPTFTFISINVCHSIWRYSNIDWQTIPNTNHWLQYSTR